MARRLVGRARIFLAIYWLTLAVCTHWPRLEVLEDQTVAPGIAADKLVHCGAFVILTLLLVAARPWPRCSFVAASVLGAVTAGGYALLDEWSQPWFDRHFTTADALANLIGVAGTLVWLLVLASPGPSPPRAVWLSRMLLVPALALRVGGSFVLDFQRPLHLGPEAYLLLPDPPIVQMVAAMVLTWLLATARLLGRSRPTLNVAATVLLIAAVGVAVAIAGDLADPGAEPPDLYWHQFGLLVALAMWSMRLLVNAASAAGSAGRPPAVSPLVTPRVATGRFVAHARLVSGLTVISRLSGLVRDAAMAALLGVSSIADAFFIGYLIPNLFRRLFGEGALSSAFIPVYSELVHKDRLTAARVASLCLALMVVVLGLITLLGQMVLLGLARTLPIGQESELAVRLAALMLPYMPMICLVAVLGAMLQVHGRFGPTAAAPIVLNGVVIGALWLAAFNVHGSDADRVAVLGAAVLAGGLIQLLWHVWAVLDVERFTWHVAGTASWMRQVLVAMLPMAVGLAVFQINALLDSLIAFGFSPKGDSRQVTLLAWQVDCPIDRSGAVAALQFAQRLYQFPLGVFGIALATAIFPALAAVAARGGADSRAELARILRQGLRLAAFVGLPASVGLILVRQPLTRLIYQHGDQFGAAESQRVALLLAAYASAVWAYTMAHVVTRAFYAVKDARTPMRISLVMVGLNLVLNLTLIWYLDVAGLAASTAICAVIQLLVLLKSVGRHIPGPLDRAVRLSWARSVWATLLMGAAVWCLLALVNPARLSATMSALVLLAAVGLGALVYIGVGWFLGVAELRWIGPGCRDQGASDDDAP